MNDDNKQLERPLVFVRCPHKEYVAKYKKWLTCNRPCVRVSPGSFGEGFCRDHGTYDFEIAEDYVPPRTIKVQKIRK